MKFHTVALLAVSLFGSAYGEDFPEFEDVPTCGSKKKQFCTTGPFYKKMVKTLENAPVVEGFYVDADETAAAQGAINDLIFYFQKKCKNCVEEDAKDTLCALKDPIYQGIFDWVSDTMKDTVATYCPPEDFVCGKKHYDHCNGDLFDSMMDQVDSCPKNGGKIGPETLNDLNGYFIATCKSCIDHANAKALCDGREAIVKGIIDNDDREYEDPTGVFCAELYGADEPAKKPVIVDNPVNLAKGKGVKMSSVYATGKAGLAVDGNTDGHWEHGSVAITKRSANNWWQVTLGSSVITKIVIFNRTDCCKERIQGASVQILNGGKVAAEYKVRSTPGEGHDSYSFAVANVAGDTVKISIANEYLQLAEVQVFGASVDEETSDEGNPMALE